VLALYPGSTALYPGIIERIEINEEGKIHSEIDHINAI
jgi:hypothetical protein